MQKFEFTTKEFYLLIEEDVIGWYLIVFKKENKTTSISDYLYDNLEDVFFEAQERFGVSKDKWEVKG